MESPSSTQQPGPDPGQRVLDRHSLIWQAARDYYSFAGDACRLVAVNRSSHAVEVETPVALSNHRTSRRPARYDLRGPTRPTVSVIVPSFNEYENIGVLLTSLIDVLADFDHEIVVVDDDSPDGTWRLAEEFAATNPRVQVLRRVGRRGLSSAVIDGMTVARGDVMVVLDADLQHDETKLPAMIASVLDDGFDVCIGTRNGADGSYGSFGLGRRFLSGIGAEIARRLLGVTVSDPMTGYFAISRQRFDQVRSVVDPKGFKVVLEVLARGPQPVVAEVGYQFRTRTRGQTKLSIGVVVAFLWSVVGLAIGRTSSARFATFAAIAVTGLCMRLSIHTLLGGLLPGLWPLGISFTAAGLFEFGLHQRLTFAAAGRRHRRGPLARLTLFHLIGAHSALALGGSMALLDEHPPSLESGLGLSTVLGASTFSVLLAVILSYVANRSLTWAPAASSYPRREKTSSTSPEISETALR